MNSSGLLLIGIGLFSLLGGLFNWGWFINSRKARGVSRLLGPLGARIFYICLGLGVVLLGALMTTNLLAGF